MDYPKIIFRESDHTYWYGTGPIDSDDRVRLTSVNQLWSKWCQPFDEDLTKLLVSLSVIIGHKQFWREYFMQKSNMDINDPLVVKSYFLDRYDNISENDISDMINNVTYWWNHGNDLGTDMHNKLEDKVYSDGFFESPVDERKHPVMNIEKKYDNQTICENLYDLKDGVYPELLVWNAEAKVCGQADIVIIETIDDVRYVSIHDFKTNGGYSEEAGLKKRKEICSPRKGKTMKEPFNHLYDCLYTKYNGQISMYAHLMELAGYKVRHLTVGHYLNYDIDSEFVKEFDYLGDECSKMLELKIRKDALGELTTQAQELQMGY